MLSAEPVRRLSMQTTSQPLREQEVAEVRADEAGAARHEHAHRPSLSPAARACARSSSTRSRGAACARAPRGCGRRRSAGRRSRPRRRSRFRYLNSFHSVTQDHRVRALGRLVGASRRTSRPRAAGLARCPSPPGRRRARGRRAAWSSRTTSRLLASRMSSVLGLKARPSTAIVLSSSGPSALRIMSTRWAARSRLISTTERSSLKS